MSIPSGLRAKPLHWEPVPVEVLNTAGRWIAGFELLHFDAEGTATIRSVRSGATRSLSPGHWRDPWPATIAQFPEISGTHPALDAIPWGSAEEYLQLERSIARDGLCQPVVIDGSGLLLDGRRRVLACARTGQPLLIDTYLGSDPACCIRSLNLVRQHLSPDDLAEVRRKLITLVGAERAAALLEVA